MLEGAVARLLNQLLGKYVVDLDTENLNVGIFSGHVQLTDLKLKPEALYELDLPIEVKAGTIGKIWLQIPWSMLLSQPVIVNIEDVHVVASPIVTYEAFDAEKNKRLLRALKRKALADLNTENEIIGGPSLFSEYLMTSIINNLQLNITNVHIRYEDSVSDKSPLACGICIGNITAETTNSKWKASKNIKSGDTSYYLVKIEALSIYWNPNHNLNEWNLPSQYYAWRNAMSSSLQNFSINDEDFDFLIKPMTTKIKMTINKSSSGNIDKLLSDIIIQDCNIQVSENQFQSIVCVADSLSRMFVSWNFLSMRPNYKILENKKSWWKYAYRALLEQRIKPYTWSRVKTIRQYYKKYAELYKKILLNPNDTELKLDLQKYEDQLSIVNIVIARQQARLTVHENSLSEKSFWDLLPSPERTILCEKIGFSQCTDKDKHTIEHNYNFRIGNISFSLVNLSREILVLTITQLISNLQPNFANDTYKASLKVEAIIIEGASLEEHLVPIISSEHLTVHDSPAYFLKINLEKLPPNSSYSHLLNCTLEYLEISYHKHSFDELEKFVSNQYVTVNNFTNFLQNLPKVSSCFLKGKLLDKWDLNFDLKIPYIVIPQSASLQTGENILIIDLGHVKINTELCQVTELSENSTHMELEEQLYSRLHIKCSNTQLLFCDSSEDWRSGRKEKDTDLHILSKTHFTAVYGNCVKPLSSIPKEKFNITFPTIKLNISERKISVFLMFLNTLQLTKVPSNKTSTVVCWSKDKISARFSRGYLLHVQNYITIEDIFVKSRRHKEKRGSLDVDKRASTINYLKENINEAWARCVDLPGLEDNISPSNTISHLLQCVVKEFQLVFSKSSDSTDRQYITLKLGLLTMDAALMTYGPAYQISLNSILLTDKLHTTSSGQYLDLVHTPLPSNVDVLTVLYRKVSASCPDFWTHFHGVETSLVADFGTLNLMLHQEAMHTIIKYTRYIKEKVEKQISANVVNKFLSTYKELKKYIYKKTPETPVPPGSVKFSHSARLTDISIRVCDSDYDIINVQVSGLEMDFLFRANERFVFRSYLATLNVEHLSDITLYTKVLSTDEDKVFEVKYVRHASHIHQKNDISPTTNDIQADGTFKFYLGQIHITFLYKLFVQLHRFVINLEAISFIESAVLYIQKAITRATETLKNSTKINLAVNIKGPVLLFPQKSSSPNVVIINTGEFNVENFFKDYPNECIENILLKVNGITVSRGIMTLTSTLEMQEIIVEPVNLHLDIKRFTPTPKSTIKNPFWDVDGVMDTIQITLGQRDLSTILAIHSDNIGEGKLLDLFPVPIKSPTTVFEADDTVKTLEAFFCEPKQKNISVKLSFDGINFLLFFDSGELLSSPIRDLNHGLCKFEIADIATSFILFTDSSLDGKLSVDTLSIEEIGPDANLFEKGILQSPIDDNKNNNCNITVNKPPIVDLTFHQTKAGDKSIDIIIGRLSLSLSVPFCEKLAMFVLECLPKDTLDLGFINHGYVSDQVVESTLSKTSSTSLTIALRINRPEFIFIVETTSNKKRYFITKTEILSDYSRHTHRLNLVISLSGLHSLFYDVGINCLEPYTILKQCDVELSKSYTEEKGEKVTVNISSIQVQLCNRVVYSINDILNDIVEHFKIPEHELTPRRQSKSDTGNHNTAELWEPKNVSEYICKQGDEYVISKNVPVGVLHEVFLLPKTEIVVILELDEVPVLLLKTTIEMTMYDWSSLLNCTCELTTQANYFNDGNQTWEPFIDPIVLDEFEYKPWEMNVRIFQDKSLPMLSNIDNKTRKDAAKDKKSASASSTEEEEESGDDMIYLQPTSNFYNRINRNIKTSLSTFLDDSDSENEDGTMEKLAAAISDLFTGDWNESDASESDHSSEGEDESEDDVKLKSTDTPNIEQTSNYKKSTYILLDAKDILNFTITPTFLKVLNELFTIYSNKTLSIVSNKRSINLVNDIGPRTKVELFENRGTKSIENSVLMCSKTYEMQDSCPNSPTKSNYAVPEFSEETNDDRDSYTDDISKVDVEMGFDLEASSTLEFPIKTTPHLYEKINKHHLKLYVPGFQSLQTSCPKKSWQKLMRLQSLSSNQIYYLLAKHSIDKHGRTVVISSPLQIRNETCFALSVLYEPSVLQQLNLEPVGDMTNPFETTMRIAVLEPHEQYNVPLHIAYHCKLFIQPAYAEGHYVSDAGIWWKDLATELDIAHNFHCNPKSNSNLEVFSLRIVLKRNIEINNSNAHFIPNYVIHLLPPLIIHNYLPYALEAQNVDLKQTMKVEPGEKTSAYSLNLSKDQKLQIKISYTNLVWNGCLNLTTHLDEKIVHLTCDTKTDGNNKHLAVHVKTEREGSCNLFFYTPYWVINKTGLPLHIKASSTNTIYESLTEDILLFSYRRHGKQSLNLKVYESDWSNDFGIECAGTTGLIVCRDNERKKRYSFLLSIRLSQMCPRFTKIVTLLPNFLVANNTNKVLRFMEQNEKTDLWIDLQPSQCVSFWPETSSMQMCVKYRDSKLTSQAFFISSNHHTVLRMDKSSAICVDVTGGRTDCFRITFNEYKDGDAPALIKNMCADLFLKIQQQGQGQVTLLNPYHSLMYTWDDPTKPRQLLWNVYNNKGFGFHIDISKDCYGEEKINFHSVTPGTVNQSAPTSSSSDDSDSCDSVKTTLNKKVHRDKIVIYWVCYRNGLQKTLLFTQEQRVYDEILKVAFMEQSDVECILSLSGIGASIFTSNNSSKEHIYMTLADSPAIWEVNVGHKWKTLTLELASWIEDKYRLPYKKCQLKDYIHIDFEKMFMLKPFFAELRRTYNPAFYLQFRKSTNHQYISFKVQSLQVDNKHPNSNDSVMLYRLPSDTIKTTPFIEFFCFKNVLRGFDVYKQIQLNVEDFYVNVESDLVFHLANLLNDHRKLSPECSILYRNDMCLIRAPNAVISKECYPNKTIIESLKISQIGIQLNISHKNQIISNNGYPITKVLDYIFPTNLSPYMPAEGVRHKINPLESTDMKKDFCVLLLDIWNHFSSQFLQQYYSQVLGQQVLVNPYAIQAVPSNEKNMSDCEKISSVILYGCRCFLGHVNMSSAALEQCVMDIFANQNLENIQRIRRINSYHKSSTMPKSIIASSKSFNPGVVLALDQIIIKNQNGLQCDGEAFFRGTGKALQSLITRHPDEKSNSVQVAIEALRRASILGEPVRTHQRLTRYYNNNLGLKPFSVYESMGHHLLETVANGRFSNDTYWAHAAIDKLGKSIIIISLEHIIRVNKCRFWGPWELEWSLDMDDVVSVPQAISNELVFNVRQGENNFVNSSGKLTIAGHKEVLVWLQEKVEQAMVVSMEDKSWAIVDN